MDPIGCHNFHFLAVSVSSCWIHRLFRTWVGVVEAVLIQRKNHDNVNSREWGNFSGFGLSHGRLGILPESSTVRTELELLYGGALSIAAGLEATLTAQHRPASSVVLDRASFRFCRVFGISSVL